MNESETTNPFGAMQTARTTGGALAQSDQQRAVAEVQAAMMIARMNPRDQIASMDRILNACSRPTLADSAVYTYSRGGTDISGPSIRLAEAMAQSWGNMQFGIRELDQRNGESTVQAFAWDVESNTRREVTFQVPHIRYTKKGSYKLEDPRDIYEAVANQGARRLRACILSVIPGDVTEAAVSQCEVTMNSKADTSPEAMKKMIDAFEKFGVTKEQIEKRIQRRIDAIKPAQVVALKKIYASLRDAMSSPGDWFEDAGSNMTADTPGERKPFSDDDFARNISSWEKMIHEGKKTAAQIIAMANAKAPLTEEQIAKIKATKGTEQSPSGSGITFAKVEESLRKAKDVDVLDVAADLIGELSDPQQRRELQELYESRKEELSA